MREIDHEHQHDSCQPYNILFLSLCDFEHTGIYQQMLTPSCFWPIKTNKPLNKQTNKQQQQQMKKIPFEMKLALFYSLQPFALKY